MPIIDTAIRTISCDGPGCTKQVLFDRKDEKTRSNFPRTSGFAQLALFKALMAATSCTVPTPVK